MSRRHCRPVAATSLALLLALVASLTLVTPGIAGAESPAKKKKPPAASPVAHALLPTIEVFEDPGTGAPTHILQNPTSTGGELVFLVESISVRGWTKVLLPVKPNGTTGWIRSSDVTIEVNPYRIVIDLGDHKLTTYKGRKVFLEVPAGIGKGNTPTPGGKYYITQLFQPPDPGGAYGPYAYSLSGFSEVLTEFRGGDAIIGIHGTNQPDQVGQDVSAGCIRIKNEDVRKLATVLPLGTPVEINA